MMDGVAYAPLKRRSTSTRLHAAISQAVIFNFIWMQKYPPYCTMFICDIFNEFMELGYLGQYSV
jgi:hypothetical protein